MRARPAKRVRRRRMAAVAGPAVALSLVAAACGGSSSTGSSAGAGSAKGGGVTVDGVHWPRWGKDIKLNVWTFGGEPGTGLSIKAFEKAYPDIKIHYSDVGGGTAEYAKLATVIHAGAGAPDVALVEYDALPQFVSAKGLVNQEPYVGKWMSLVPAWVRAEVTFNGGVYDFPAGGGTMGLFSNQKLLSKYGLAIPKTYAQFASEAATLHKDDPKVAMTYFPINDGGYIQALWMQAGAVPFTMSSSGTWTIDLDQPKIERVTSYWVNLVRKGLIPVYSDYTPTWEHAISAGTFATFLGASWEPGYGIAPYVKNGSQSFVVTDMPQWSSSGTPIDANWGGSGYVVTKQTKYPEAASLFAAFMDLGTVKQAMADGGSPPLVNNVDTYKEFKTGGKVKDFNQPNLNIVFNRLQKYVSTSFHFSPWYTELGADLEVQLEAAVSGKQTAAQALSKTQSEIASFARTQGYTVNTK